MKIEHVHTQTMGDAHAWTRSRSPWIMDEYESVYGKLIHYLSGGGMEAFGRTVRQEEVRCRHRRFWAVAAVLVSLWFLFLVF